MVDSTTATGVGGNPFTNPDATARLHANANAAFMRDIRPGNASDAGGNANHDFSTDGQAHPFDDAHPDQTSFPSLPSLPTLPTQARPRTKKFTFPPV